MAFWGVDDSCWVCNLKCCHPDIGTIQPCLDLDNADNTFFFCSCPLGRPDLLRLGDLPGAAVLLSPHGAGLLLPGLQR